MKNSKRMAERCQTIKADAVVWRGKINSARERSQNGFDGAQKAADNLNKINEVLKNEIVRSYGGAPTANLNIISMFSATIPNLTQPTKKKRTA